MQRIPEEIKLLSRKNLEGVSVILILKYQIHSEGILKKFAQRF